jgi:RNA polymerase sigma factor (sigma-70 family)
VDEKNSLARPFEESRPHLRAVAYRMLGSASEADDAVQEAWLRLHRADMAGVENLRGWLTTVVARVCLDMLRARKARPDEAVGATVPEPASGHEGATNAEEEMVLADSVGLALLVVLETLDPPERLAFVLHDLFGVSFEEIAPIVGRNPAAARQLASRARRRVQGAKAAEDADLSRQRQVIDAFLAAAAGGDLAALLAVLDPDVVFRADAAVMRAVRPPEIRGAQQVAELAARGGARAARPALIDGAIGLVVAPRGKLLMVLRITFAEGKIVAIDAVGEPATLRELDIEVLGEGDTPPDSGAAPA